MAIKKQFIAGASCPSCNEKDVVQLWQETLLPGSDQEPAPKKMYCIACGYEEVLGEKADLDSTTNPVEIFRG